MRRAAVAGLLLLTLAVFGLHAARVRPYHLPAGTGLVLTHLTVLAGLHPLPRIAAARPPDVSREAGQPVVVAGVVPGSPANAAGLASGMRLSALHVGDAPPLWSGPTLPTEAEALLRVWRAAYWARAEVAPWRIYVPEPAAATLVLPQTAAWRLPSASAIFWLQAHGLPLLTAAAFLGGAVALLVLRTRGGTATSMLLALAGSALANLGPAYGSEALLGVLAAPVLLASWMAAPLVFPLVGLAVLNFPRRAALLDRHPWLPFALMALAAPMLLNTLAAAGYLLGAEWVLPLLAWLAARRWTFDAPFFLAMAANVAIAVEGWLRYRANRDLTERRRIQLAVLTGVPAVLAYGVLAVASLARPSSGPASELPWPLTLLLSLLVILPAIGLPYAAVTRRLFAPRTVVRRSLQYALARRTLSLLLLLPAALLVAALLRQRDLPLATIVLGAPLFYAACIALIVAGLVYRDAARRWLDRQFFHAEHRARELLLSLAKETPFAADPEALVATAAAQIDGALSVESIAILSGEPDLEVRWQQRSQAGTLPGASALATLLRWSDEPLEVGGEHAGAAALRLPEPDRRWIVDAGAVCLVPLLAGAGETRRLIGLLVLGAKHSEEPFTSEELALLRGIGGQLAVALAAREQTGSEHSREVSAAVGGYGETSPQLALHRGTSDGGQAVSGRFPPSRPDWTSPAAMARPRPPLPRLRRDHAEARANRSRAKAGDSSRESQPRAEAGREVQRSSSGDDLPSVVDGKYRIEARIGQGGMGTVYRARDVRLDREVALKVVRTESASAEAQARFLREARIVARLQHPAVVTIFDVGNLPDGAAYLVMELVEGEDLRRVLRRQRQLSPPHAAEIFVAVAEGVDAAHRHGVLHRDLKPENIVLTPEGRAKVLDFGVAKLGDAASSASMVTLETFGAIVGTPAYMAPEQLRGEPLDPRADIFSLGVTLYECLTGALPFGGGTVVDYAVRYASGTALEAGDALTGALREPVLQALALSREERQRSAAAFADAIRSAIVGGP